MGLGMAAVLVVVDGQQVVGVHDLDDVRRPVAAHEAHARIVLAELLVELDAGLGDGLEVHVVVQIALHLTASDDQGLDLLVPEHGADAAAARLLQADADAQLVEPGEVQHADEAVVRF